MTISRHHLYSHGEPFGDSSTRRKITGGYICGFGGDSSSSSAASSTNTSNATDNRLAIGNGSIGASTGGIVSLSDMRDMSTNLEVNDSSNRSSSTSWSDTSNRSVNNSGNTTITSVDPGALKAMERSILSNETIAKEAFKFAGTANSDALGFAQASADASTAATRGAYDKAFGSLDKAFSSIQSANATASSGFSKLLDLGASMFDSNVKAVQNSQALTAAAYQNATAEKSGSLDNKTILILGVAAVAGFAFIAAKR